MEYEECGVQGTLSDLDAMKLQNLAFTDSIWTWEHRHLTCQLPAGHANEEHVTQLARQLFKDPVVWWASWLDTDALRDAAAMFTAPECGAVDPNSPHPPGQEGVCQFLQGHDWSEGDQHVYL
ncbi:hypothetical protein ACFU8I_02815 [Streptomyces sp. NPDC057540]|uniref:hypothetical protein n=1 Tax=Streptomyces sp. NPDC057540 TaxID=3346160 RepID=UPI0036CD6A93